MKILTGGTFDLIHYGHILHLRFCIRLADYLKNVGIMLVSDAWAESRKGKRHPVLLYEERKKILQALGFENIFPVNGKEDILAVVKLFKPDIYVYDYESNKEAHEAAVAYCEGNEIITFNLGKVPRNPFGTSTSSIIEKILE